MSTVRLDFGLVVDLVASAMWGVAAFFLVSRLVSPAAGGAVGLGVFFLSLGIMLTDGLQERRARLLQQNACPRCRAALRQSHEHRRWDTGRSRWLAPLTTWECRECGYGHEEPAPCKACPEAA